MISLVIALALAQPVSNGKFNNLTVQGTERVAVLDAGTALINGQLQTLGPIIGGSTVVSGTTMASGTTLRFGTQLLNGNAQLVMSTGQLGYNESDINGNSTNTAGNASLAFYNPTTMTAGFDRYIAILYADAFLTPRARIFTNGTYQNLYTAGTAGSGTGITAAVTSAVVHFVHKVTVINTALTAAATTDLTIWTTPVNTRLIRITADVTQVFTGGSLSAMTLTCGNAAGGNQYLLSNSVFTAQNTWGDAAAEIGAGLLSATVADMGTSAAGIPGAIAISCRFTCTGANCSAATQGSVTFEIEGVTYP